MSRVVVRNQAELDEALARTDLTYAFDEIVIDSPRGECLVVDDTRGLDVHASGSATVRVSGSAIVRASDSATVRAHDSVTVRAHEYAAVVAYDSAAVLAYGSAEVTASDSVTVHAYDSATATAYDFVTVHAYDSAAVRACDFVTVRAHDSATVVATGTSAVTASGSAEVTAYDFVTVRAYDSASVTAYGSATVHASGLGTVTAGSRVAIHQHTTRVTVHGGTIIDHTNVALNSPHTWADYTGAHIQDGEVVLYKAVDDTLTAGHSWTPTTYPIGQTVTCEDWRDDNDCGGGLHASPHPHQALSYYSNAERMLRVAAPLDSIRPIGMDKAKAPMFRVLDEVTLKGRPLTEAEAR